MLRSTRLGPFGDIDLFAPRDLSLLIIERKGVQFALVYLSIDASNANSLAVLVAALIEQDKANAVLQER